MKVNGDFPVFWRIFQYTRTNINIYFAETLQRPLNQALYVLQTYCRLPFLFSNYIPKQSVNTSFGQLIICGTSISFKNLEICIEYVGIY